MLFYQPALHGAKENNDYRTRSMTFCTPRFRKYGVLATEYYNVENNLYTQETFGLFFFCCLYTTSFLPYGRFYNRVGGNTGSLMSFMYIFSYLTFPFLRKPYTKELLSLFYFRKIIKLINFSRKCKKTIYSIINK